MVRTGRTMSFQITTHKDVLRHTARRVAIASGLTIVMTSAIALLSLGTNPAAQVSVGYVIIMSLFAATTISASLSGALSYRSALLMQQLTLMRGELARISQTDQLTGLFNRRGFDEAEMTTLASAYHDGMPAVVFFCHVEYFKSINID